MFTIVEKVSSKSFSQSLVFFVRSPGMSKKEICRVHRCICKEGRKDWKKNDKVANKQKKQDP